MNTSVSQVTIPSQFVEDGPVTRTIKGKIDDKNGGFNEYTVTLTVNNIVPIIDPIDNASLPGPGNYFEPDRRSWTRWRIYRRCRPASIGTTIPATLIRNPWCSTWRAWSSI